MQFHTMILAARASVDLLNKSDSRTPLLLRNEPAESGRAAPIGPLPGGVVPEPSPEPAADPAAGGAGAREVAGDDGATGGTSPAGGVKLTLDLDEPGCHSLSFAHSPDTPSEPAVWTVRRPVRRAEDAALACLGVSLTQ